MNVNAIYKAKIPEEFAKQNRQYTAESKKQFHDLLRQRNLPVTETSAHYILKRELMRYTKGSLYDLEFDTQLRKALDVLNGG